MSLPTTPAAAPLRPVRNAASLIVLRDGHGGLEVLMLRRAEKENDQNSGASVFPGGTVDANDPALHAACRGLDDAAASARLNVTKNGLDYYAAAVRECFEEAGLLYASAGDGPLVSLDALAPEALAAMRQAAEQGSDALTHMCAERGWQLAVDRLTYFSHWLTPPGMPRRFDTRFFVALAPSAQTPVADTRETVECLWLTPEEALSKARGLKLMNVTRRILEQLKPFASAQACIDHTRALQRIAIIMPRVALGRGGAKQPVNPWEPGYAEVGRLDPDGRGDASAVMVPGAVVRLSPHVIRVESNGRNGYLVGDEARNEWAAIDGEAALLAAAPGPVRWTLSTSSAEVRDGETISVGGLTMKAFGVEGRTCWLLADEKTLFCGEGAHPRTLLPSESIDWLAPAQGFLLSREEPMSNPFAST